MNNKSKLRNYLYNKKDHYKKQEECPEITASCVSLLTFSWIQKMIIDGYRKPLTIKDIPNLPDRLKSENTTKLLKNINFNSYKRFSSIKGLPLIIHTYKSFLPRNKIAILLLTLCNSFIILTPLSLKFFLKYISLNDGGSGSNIGTGILLCFGLFFCSLMTNYINHLANWISMRTALEVLGSYSSVIFEKMLKLSNHSKKEYGSVKILNLISNDTGTFCGYFWNEYIENIILPIQAIALLSFLCQLIGPSGLIGVLILVLSIPLNAFLSSNLSHNLKKSIEYSDCRISETNELINGIKFLKQYCWESIFLKKISIQRDKQLEYLYKRSMYLMG